MRATIYLEVFLAVLAVLFIVWQFLVPAIRGTKLLPLFRKERELKADILKEQQTSYEQDLESTRVEAAKALAQAQARPKRARKSTPKTK